MWIALGIIIGAWAFQKGGWKLAVPCALTMLVAGLVDVTWGDEIGFALGEKTRSFFE